MPRSMSFSKTTAQVRARTKTVTRRLGWRWLQVGTLLWAVEKGRGLKKGERVKRLALIRVVGVNVEPLQEITLRDVIREGFPGWTPADFVRRFCEWSRVTPEHPVTVIKFEYVKAA